jgi:hypothetical protein
MMAVIRRDSGILLRSPPHDNDVTRNTPTSTTKYHLFLFYVLVVVIPILFIVLTLCKWVCRKCSRRIDIEAQRVDRHERLPLLHRMRAREAPWQQNDIQRAQQRERIKTQRSQDIPEGREFQGLFGTPLAQTEIQIKISSYIKGWTRKTLTNSDGLTPYRKVVLNNLLKRISDSSLSQYLDVWTLRRWEADDDDGFQLIHFLTRNATSLGMRHIAEFYFDPLLSLPYPVD